MKVVNINDYSTYGEVAEAIVEHDKAENEAPEKKRNARSGTTQTQGTSETSAPNPKLL